ncbi:MAG: TolC family protein [Bacteroidetes bacterium]|nr:TolC family protein [Bacteroidota bacterium]
MKLLLFYFAFCILHLSMEGQNNPSLPAINTNDSLEFRQILKQVLDNHPLVLRAKEGITMAEAGIGLAKSAWYPNIDAEAGYTRIGPVPAIIIEHLGSIEIAPTNYYNGSLSVGQTIYDFSKTKRNIKLEESNREISEKNVELVKQKLTMLTALSFYSLIYLQEAINIKEVELKTLKEHLDFVTRKKETGSATQYEILTTQVRISSAENQKVDLKTSWKSQLGNLNSLLDFPINTLLHVKNSLIPINPGTQTDSLISYALAHRYEMVIAKLNHQHAELKLNAVKIQNNPVFRAFASGGVKNGYFPDLNQPVLNFAAGVVIKMPLFDATHRKYNMLQASTQINISKDETDLTKRQISQEVNESECNITAALQKIKQSELLVKQAEEALSLARVNFNAGAITNLDLLDTETSVAESKLALLKAKVDFAVSIVKLELSMGIQIN